MPQTTINSSNTIFIFVGMLFLSGLSLYMINYSTDVFDFSIHKNDIFQYQLTSICILSMLWFGLLAVKKRIKALFVGLAVALVNSFSTFMLLGKLKAAYRIDLPFDVVALVSCIIMVFVLNKRYFSSIIS